MCLIERSTSVDVSQQSSRGCICMYTVQWNLFPALWCEAGLLTLKYTFSFLNYFQLQFVQETFLRWVSCVNLYGFPNTQNEKVIDFPARHPIKRNLQKLYNFTNMFAGGLIMCQFISALHLNSPKVCKNRLNWPLFTVVTCKRRVFYLKFRRRNKFPQRTQSPASVFTGNNNCTRLFIHESLKALKGHSRSDLTFTFF